MGAADWCRPVNGVMVGGLVVAVEQQVIRISGYEIEGGGEV